MKIVNVQQRSDEWHRWREKGISASEIAVILDRNPDKTRWRLWAEKLGKVPRDDPSKNPHVRRGVEKEGLARQLAEDLLGGDVLLPVCGEYDEDSIFRASLDGLSSNNEPVELKCPARSTFEDAKANAELSKAYQLYYPQVQQQLLVTGGTKGFLLLYFDEDGEKDHVLFTIARDETLIQEILTAGREFWGMLTSGKEPIKDPLRDVLVPEGVTRGEWATLAAERRRQQKFLDEAKAQAKRIEGLLKDNEKALVGLMGEFMRAECDGVAITRYSQQGNVDYKQLLADLLPTLDEDTLNKYRGAESSRVRVTLTDTAEAEAKAAQNRQGTGDASNDAQAEQPRSAYAW